MRFDLVKFFRTATRPYETEYTVDLSEMDFPGYEVETPVQVQFEASVRDELVLDMVLAVQATVKAECARCLEPLTQSFRVEKEYSLRDRELLNEDPDLPIDAQGVLDLDELVYQELVMEIPTVLHCSANCTGLCPVCGKSKTAGCTCGSSSEEGALPDPRLSILDQLLN